MIVASLKNLNRKASKGNFKAYRIRLYYDNLIQGLADILRHKDLAGYPDKKELIRELIQTMSAIGWLRLFDDFADVNEIIQAIKVLTDCFTTNLPHALDSHHYMLTLLKIKDSLADCQ